MNQHVSLVTLVVDNYDDAIAFYCNTLGFDLLEDTELPAENKRWVVVAPTGAENANHSTRLLLAKASNDTQHASIGKQTGGRVGFFLSTDDFWRDFRAYKASGVQFVREPVEQPYGTVAVFSDIYGNLWDLLQPNPLCD